MGDRIIALIPSTRPPPPITLAIPTDMTAPEQENLIQQLHAISVEIAGANARNDERHRAMMDRIVKLEASADATGAYGMQQAQYTAQRWEAWLLRIAAALIVAAIAALLTHWIGAK